MTEAQEITYTWRLYLQHRDAMQQADKLERWGWAIILTATLIVPALVLGGILHP